MPIKITMRNQIPPVRIAILTSLQTINEGESLEGREPTYTVGGYIYWHSHYKRQSPNARKKKKTRELSLEFDIPTPGPISQENHNSVRHMHPNIHCSTTYNSQNTEPAECPPPHSSSEKMWCVHAVDYYSATNTHELPPLVATGRDLGG